MERPPVTPLERHLASRAEALGAPLDPAPREALVALTRLLERWAARMNLTGHRDAEAIVDGLIVDALALHRELPSAASIVDLGSGAGFPGLPLAILRPDTEVRLVDSRERRHHFQKAAIRELGLSRATPIRGRIESLDPMPGELVIAQALAQPAAALQLSLPWVAPGGWIALPGSDRAPEPGPDPAIAAAEVREYAVPGRSDPRTLWLGRVHARA